MQVVRCYSWDELVRIRFGDSINENNQRVISITPIEKIKIENSVNEFRCFDFDYILVLEQ